MGKKLLLIEKDMLRYDVSGRNLVVGIPYQSNPPFGIDDISQMLHGAGIFTNIYPKNPPSVGNYTIHGAYEYGLMWWFPSMEIPL